MKIEFQNTIRRLNFLCHLTDIKIAWINPCIAKSFIELSVNVLGNHWATETLTAFSISKSLQVLKKTPIKIVAHAIYTYPFFYIYIHSPLMLKKSCCDFCFPQESKSQTGHCSMIYMTRGSVRIGFNVI